MVAPIGFRERQQGRPWLLVIGANCRRQIEILEPNLKQAVERVFEHLANGLGDASTRRAAEPRTAEYGRWSCFYIAVAPGVEICYCPVLAAAPAIFRRIFIIDILRDGVSMSAAMEQ